MEIISSDRDKRLRTAALIFYKKHIDSFEWITENQIDYSHCLQRPTVFFLSDDVSMNGINTGFVDQPAKTVKKSKRMMEMTPVKNAIMFAALNGCSFRFYDPYQDEKYVADGDIVVYMGDASKRIAEYLHDGLEIEVIKARDIKNKIKGLQDCYIKR